MKTRSKLIFVLVVLASIGGLGYWGFVSWSKALGAMAAMQASMNQGVQEMPVARCVIQDVTDYSDFTGVTEAVNSVEIRARVAGYLQEIHFADGAAVEKGQLLFTIEPEAYLATRDEAMARLNAAEAELERTRLDLERVREAAGSNAVSRQDLSRSEAAYHTAEANVAAAKASLDSAQLNLSYTKIHSPISGRVSRRRVDVGNLVGAGEQTLLTTVVQTDPIYVSFHAGEKILTDALFLFAAEREKGSPVRSMPFQVGLPGEADYLHAGELNFLDNTVDPTTGTVYVRGEIRNDGLGLLPGMYMRVRVPMGVRRDAVLLDETVINTDLDGKYVLVVGEGNVLERRKLILGRVEGGLRVVIEGLNGGELCLAGNFHIARPGMEIIPTLEGKPLDAAPGESTAQTLSDGPEDSQS